MDSLIVSKEIDFHLLDLRYSHTRIQSNKALAKMRNSISEYGQLVPAVVIAEQDIFVMIDGYLRLAALNECGHDVIKVLIVPECEPEALISLLVKNHDQPLETIEQAALIQELHSRFSYTFAEIAKRLGRDKSWVKRRLDLLESLPEEVRQGVMQGKVSPWAASRILVPLARANEADCIALTSKIIADPLTTRELVILYDHYRKSTRKIRERLIADPALFIRTVRDQEQQKAGKLINEGPEGQWFKDISIVCHILKRLGKTSKHLFYPNKDSQLSQRCLSWLGQAEKGIIALQEQVVGRGHDNTSM